MIQNTKKGIIKWTMTNDSRQNLEVVNGDFDLESIDPSMKPML